MEPESEEVSGGGDMPRPIFRDIRRYYCDYCGICRSKKTLITSHILTHHKEEMNERGVDEDAKEGPKSNTCEECGATFKKPAHLRQHLQSHSIEGNLKRHVKDLHEEGSPSIEQGRKQYVCREDGCGKVFKFASKLQKHEDSHVKLDSVEAFCAEPGCMKYFTNEQCLKAHKQSCHQHIVCDVCGSKQLKKNIKRHLRTHEAECSSETERIKCEFDGCPHTFSTKSNLRQHIKAVHEESRPFVCCFSGCGMRFSYKHVRDKHEKSGCHVYTPGDFVESDEQFRSRPRGGRKRACPSLEMLMRKRITPPNHWDPIMDQGPEITSPLCSPEPRQDQTGNEFQHRP